MSVPRFENITLLAENSIKTEERPKKRGATDEQIQQLAVKAKADWAADEQNAKKRRVSTVEPDMAKRAAELAQKQKDAMAKAANSLKAPKTLSEMQEQRAKEALVGRFLQSGGNLTDLMNALSKKDTKP